MGANFKWKFENARHFTMEKFEFWGLLILEIRKCAPKFHNGKIWIWRSFNFGDLKRRAKILKRWWFEKFDLKNSNFIWKCAQKCLKCENLNFSFENARRNVKNVKICIFYMKMRAKMAKMSKYEHLMWKCAGNFEKCQY